MTALYFDLGNTRIKWHAQGAGGVIEYSQIEEVLASLLSKMPSVQEVVFASVVKDERRNRFVERLSSHRGVRLFECVVTASALGVTCAYQDPSRLGIDRWLAVVAAWSICGQPVLVADLGTAATLDFIGKDGRHQGGYILPGLKLGVSSLLGGTSNVLADQTRLGEASRTPGKNTNDAVCNGAIVAMAATLEVSLKRLQLDFPEAGLLLTGGDGELVARHLDCHYQINSHLVFEGMQLMHLNHLAVEIPPQETE